MHPMARRAWTPIAVALATALVVTGCFGAETPSPTPVPTGEPAPDRRPVIIDTDVGLDDIGAMLVLLRDPQVDVRAITIAGTGLAHCQGGRLVVRYLLDELGRSDIPFGCGRAKGGEDARPFPDAWREGANAGYGLAIPPTVESGTPLDAADLLRDAVTGSPSAPTLVTLGPLTNLEDAFEADPTLPDRIAGIHAMLGTVDTPGNVTIDDVTQADPLEWNAFADPSAVAAVFATDIPIDLVPLDATRDVPVPRDLAERLDVDRAAAGADLMYELLVHNPFLMDPTQGQFLWDELAALTLSDPTLATWDKAQLAVGARGELTRDESAGRPVGFATMADRTAVEAAFLDALRRGAPRRTPFTIAGTLTATFDGTTCTMSADSTTTGYYELAYTGPEMTPSGVLVAGVRAPHTWDELEAFVAGLDLSAVEEVTPPDWILQGGQANDDAGTGTEVRSSATLESGSYGPLCLTGSWPDVTFIVGEPTAFGP